MLKKNKPKWTRDYNDATGKRRVEFRRKGHRLIRLPDYDDPAFWAEHAKAVLKTSTAPEVKPEQPVEDGLTFSKLIDAAMDSARFHSLQNRDEGNKRVAHKGDRIFSSTQLCYRDRFEVLRRRFGHLSATGITRRHIDGLMADEVKRESSKKKPGVTNSANILRDDLKFIFGHAEAMGLIDSDPTLGTKRLGHKQKHHHTWTEDEIARFEAAWPIGTPERLAEEMLLSTGQRGIDVRFAEWSHIDWHEEMIEVYQKKTNKRVWIPLWPSLKAALELAPRHSRLICSRICNRGNGDHTVDTVLQAQSFRWRVQKAARKAGLPRRCTAHGLRRAAARRLAEAGCTHFMIMAITGHEDPDTVGIYISEAEQKVGARMAFGLLQRAMLRRNGKALVGDIIDLDVGEYLPMRQPLLLPSPTAASF